MEMDFMRNGRKKLRLIKQDRILNISRFEYNLADSNNKRIILLRRLQKHLINHTIRKSNFWDANFM